MKERHGAVAAVRKTRAQLMIVLPLTMALLVGSTGFFAVSMATRTYMVHGTSQAGESQIAQLGVQIASISVIAALLGLCIAMGVTRPVRQVTEQLEALASGDLRGALQISSASSVITAPVMLWK